MMFVVFMVAGFVALYYIIASAGGWFAMIEALATFEPKRDLIAWHGSLGPELQWQRPLDGLSWALILGLSWGLVVAVSPWQSSRYLMAKDEHTVVRASCVAVGAVLILYIALVFGAIAINLANSEIDPPERALIWAGFHLMPTLPAVILMTGIMAAALSSASTFLSLVGFSASHDVFPHPLRDDRHQLRVTRFTMLGVGLAALALAYFQPPAIMWITYFAGTLFASSWGPVAFFSVWSDRITAAAAFWGIVAGFGGNALAKLLEHRGILDLPAFLDPFLIGLALSSATIWIVSCLGRASDAERAFRAALHHVPERERDERKLRGTLRIAGALIATGAIAIAFLIACYARPYAAARAAIGSSAQSIDPSGGADER
jgi:sodium/pantothenate symporter